jgi:hypothetical protein
MTTLEFTLNLPDDIARLAQEAGLLSNEAIEKLLREQLRRQAGEELRVMLDKAAPAAVPPMDEDEIQAEVDAFRDEMRVKRDTTS